MGNNKPKFSGRIKMLRKKAGYKRQEEFADAFLVSLDTVRNWEQGKTYPKIEEMIRLCDFFHCDLDYLIGRIDGKTHDLADICSMTGLSSDAVDALIRINSKKEGEQKLAIISQILAADGFEKMVRSISSVDWTYHEVEEAAASSFGWGTKDDAFTRRLNYEGLEDKARYLRVFRFEVTEAAAEILNQFYKVDSLLRRIQEAEEHFDYEALKKEAENEQ